MEKYFKALAKDSAIYGVGNAVLRILALVTAPIFTRIFIPADYGIISLVASITSFLSLLLIFGMDSALPVSFYQYKKEQKTVISTGFWFLVGWSLLLVLLGGVLSGLITNLIFHSQTYRLLLIIAFATAIFTLLINYAKAIFRLEFRAKTFALVSGIVAILSTGLMIFFVAFLHKGLVGYFIGSLVGTFLGFLLAIYLIRKDLLFSVDRKHLKEMVAYGSMIVPASVSFYVFDLADRFFINHYWNLNELGLYSIAINITAMITFFSMALGQAWSPFVLQIYYKSKKLFKEFVPRAFTYYILFFFILSVTLSLFGLELLKIFATPKFYGATRAIPPLTLAMVFSASNQVTALGISISRKTKYFALFSFLTALLNIGLNFLLIPRFGMIGAGWATASSYLFLTLSYYFTSQKFIPLEIDWQKIAKLVLLSTLVIFLGPFVLKYSFLINLFIKIVLLGIYIVLLYLFGVIEKSEISYIRKYVRRIFIHK